MDLEQLEWGIGFFDGLGNCFHFYDGTNHAFVHLGHGHKSNRIIGENTSGIAYADDNMRAKLQAMLDEAAITKRLQEEMYARDPGARAMWQLPSTE